MIVISNCIQMIPSNILSINLLSCKTAITWKLEVDHRYLQKCSEL